MTRLLSDDNAKSKEKIVTKNSNENAKEEKLNEETIDKKHLRKQE